MRTNKIHWIICLKAVIIYSFFNILPASAWGDNDLGEKYLIKKLPVGEIPIQSGVTPSGAFAATIPLNVIPGIAGMQPVLSLNYNSQAGNGLAGFGWNLSGISCISRRGLNYFQDGKTAPTVASNTEPELMLDGKRIIFDGSGTLAGSLYKRKYYLEGSNKACVVYALINSVTLKISGFEVNLPNGNRAEYMVSADNRTWPISKLTDRHGNYMTYSYSLLSGISYINSISYGGNAVTGSPHFETISFVYETRKDNEKKYDMGVAISMDQRLIGISNKLGVYNVGYDDLPTQHYSLPGGISYTTNESALSPILFYYGTNSSASNTLNREPGELGAYFPNGNKDNTIALSGRYLYSSMKEGLITYPKYDTYRWCKLTEFPYDGFHSMYSKDQAIIVTPEMGTFQAVPFTVKAGDGFRGLVTLDTDENSNTEEIVLINSVGSFSNLQTLKFTILSPNIYGGYYQRTKQYTFPSSCASNGYATPYPMTFMTGDFNGDGVEELCAVLPKTKYYGKYLYDSGIYFFDLKSNSQGSESYSFQKTPFVIEPEDVAVAADYDGDGKTELYISQISSTSVYSFEKDAASSNSLALNMKKLGETNAIDRAHYTWEGIQKTEGPFSNNWGAKHKILFGDFNGDGKTDMMLTPAFGKKKNSYATMKDGTWKQCLSNGLNGFDVTSYTTNGWVDTYKDVFMHDFNGDGRSDIVSLRDNNLQVWLSDGKSVATSTFTSYPLENLANDGKLLTVGINHTNHNRVLTHIKNGIYTKLSTPNNEQVNSFLTWINNSFSVDTKVAYGRIDGITDFYTYPSTVCSFETMQQFPYQTFKGYHWVVGETSVSRSKTDYSKVRYQYTDPVMHLQGLGFCGFRKMQSTDVITGRSRYSDFDPLQYGILKKESVTNETIENEFDIKLTPKKEIIVRLKKQIRTDNATGNKTTTGKTYDLYGNVLSKTTAYGSAVTETTTAQYINQISDGLNIIGLLQSSQTTRSSSGSSFASSTDISYNAAKLPSTVIEKTNDNVSMARSFVYDQRSNLTMQTDKPFNNSQRATSVSYVYSSNGRHVVKETDAVGSGSYTYNDKGFLTASKDYRGLETKYEYDIFGKPIKTVYPDGVIRSTGYQWLPSGLGIYSVKDSATGRPVFETFFDAFGREVGSSVSRADGKKNRIDKVYDKYGRLQKVSLPYIGTAASLWNNYAYDPYDRITSVAEPSGKTTSYSYSGLTARETSNGITTSRTFDASGRIVKVSDPAGDIIYKLKADNQPSSVTAPGNVVTYFAYDNYGRQTSIIDPSAGTKIYTYNDVPDSQYGNTVKETNANGKQTIRCFDKLGRLRYVNRQGEPSTSYTYSQFDELIKESTSSGVSKTYTYDNLGRVLSMQESDNESHFLKKTYTYSGGNVLSAAYTSPSGAITAENYTYSNGHLGEIRISDGTSIWKLNSENDLGQPTSVTTGPLSRTYTYDNYGLPRGRKAQTASGTVVQNFTTLFDARTSCLTGRGDYKYNKFETFEYDNLNRLTAVYNEVHPNGVVPFSTQQSEEAVGSVKAPPPGGFEKTLMQSIEYNANGNITNNSTVGSLSYNTSGKPYAVSGISPSGNAIPLRNQQAQYNSSERPNKVIENNLQADFSYNTAQDRFKMELTKNGSSQLKRYYLASQYELDEGIDGKKEKLYLAGGFYSAPAVYVKENNGSWKLHYICRDYLGSITQLTNSSGSLVQELNYDAWGRLRNPSTWQAYAPDTEPTLVLGRGYTGHEHLAQMGLINMNARLYDPALGRFLSPDPYVQAPDMTQNFNRYSYAMNNPLMYIDQDGESATLIVAGVAALIAGGVNLAVNWENVEGFWDGFTTFGLGAAAAATTVYTGGTGVGLWATIGVSTAGGAVIAANNDVVAQTGKNFEGWNDVDWAHVGGSSIVGGAAGLAGSAVGYRIASHSMINGISSPMFKSAAVAPFASGAGHVAGGTTANMLFGDQNFNEAFKNSFENIGASMAIGTTFSLGSTYAVSKYNGVNPWNGAKSQTSIRLVGSTIESIDDIYANPELLRGKSPLEIDGLIGSTPRWKIEALGQGSHKGQGFILREYGTNGSTGRMIQWHPGGGHHGDNPYWKVSGIQNSKPIRIF